MNKTIEKEFELSIKRCYIPTEISLNCDNCSNNFLVDLEDCYLSYPVVNKFEENWAECPKCYYDQKYSTKLTIAIETKQ